MNGIFANYLWTTVLGKRILNILNCVIFPAIYKYRCIRVYGRFKDDKYVIWDLIHKACGNSAIAESLRTFYAKFTRRLRKSYAVFTKPPLTLRNLRKVSASFTELLTRLSAQGVL